MNESSSSHSQHVIIVTFFLSIIVTKSTHKLNGNTLRAGSRHWQPFTTEWKHKENGMELALSSHWGSICGMRASGGRHSQRNAKEDGHDQRTNIEVGEDESNRKWRFETVCTEFVDGLLFDTTDHSHWWNKLGTLLKLNVFFQGKFVSFSTHFSTYLPFAVARLTLFKQ